MIINIRGTSGSGKSTLIREVMKLYPSKRAFRVVGRRQPIGYMLSGPGMKDLAIIGHYETDCGGCDTIPSLDKIYELVRQSYDMGANVLFEGLLISAEVNRTTELATSGLPLVVIGLDTPLEKCLESVNERRAASYRQRLSIREAENAELEANGRKPKPLPKEKGPVNPKNTESKHKATISTMRRLEENGVQAEWHSRESALSRIKALLMVEKEPQS